MNHQSAVLSDQQWDTIGPQLLELMSRGRPCRSNREVFEGILWVLRSDTSLARQRVGLEPKASRQRLIADKADYSQS